MSRVQITNGIWLNEFRYDNRDDAVKDAKKEAHVCGDKLKLDDLNVVEIFNWHQQGVRWRAFIKEKKGE